MKSKAPLAMRHTLLIIISLKFLILDLASNEVIFEIVNKTNGLQFTDAILATKKDHDIFIRLEELLDTLGLYHKNDKGQITGFYSKKSMPYSYTKGFLFFDEKKCKISNNTFGHSFGDIAKCLKIDYHINTRELKIFIHPTYKTPKELNYILKSSDDILQNSQNIKNEDFEYSLFNYAKINHNLLLTSGSNSKTQSTNDGNLNAAFLYNNIKMRYNFNDREKKISELVFHRRYYVKNEYLPNQYKINDINTSNFSKIPSKNYGKGLFLSNQKSFHTLDSVFKGDLKKDWIAKGYLDGKYVGTVQEKNLKYIFTNVNVTSLNSEFIIKKYGPYGRVETEVKELNKRDMFINKFLNYDIYVLDNQLATDIKKSFYRFIYINYGINRQHSYLYQKGSIELLTSKSQSIHYNLSRSNTKESVQSINLHNNNNKYVSSNLNFEKHKRPNHDDLIESEENISTRIATKSFRLINTSQELKQSKNRESHETTWLTRTQINNHGYIFEQETFRYIHRKSGFNFYSKFYIFRNNDQFSLESNYTQDEFSDIQIKYERFLKEDHHISSNVFYDLKTNNRLITLSHNSTYNYLNINTNISSNLHNEHKLSLALSSSILLQGKQTTLTSKTSNEVLHTFIFYYDNNNNNKIDKDEKRIPNVKVTPQHSTKKLNYTNNEGEYSTWAIESDIFQYEFSLDSIDQPYLHLKEKVLLFHSLNNVNIVKYIPLHFRGSIMININNPQKYSNIIIKETNGKIVKDIKSVQENLIFDNIKKGKFEITFYRDSKIKKNIKFRIDEKNESQFISI